MEEIKRLNDTIGQEIFAVLGPTIQTFLPLLAANKASIQSVPRRTTSYGTHPRQQLDIYASTTTSPSTSPILLFFYGGGLIFGDKILDNVPDGLVYANLGAFFAQRGITTIVVDYRRVKNPQNGGEDAVFPSGGADVAAALKWLEGFTDGDTSKVFIAGNSAGGLHVSTFLLEPSFQEQRTALAGGGKVTLRGAVGIAVPWNFGEAAPGRTAMLDSYYGSVEKAHELCPYGLLAAATKSGRSKKELGIPPLVALLGEYDPEDEIALPTRQFVDLANKNWGEEGVKLKAIEGHNHISPPWTLMTGDTKGEKWGEELAEWIKSH